MDCRRRPTLRLAANSKWCSFANKQSRTKFNGAGMQCKCGRTTLAKTCRGWKVEGCKSTNKESELKLQFAFIIYPLIRAIILDFCATAITQPPIDVD